jgi:hypothetical protein
MRDLRTRTHGKSDDAVRRATNGIKRVGGTMLAGAIITAACLQAAPVDKAFAETQTKQEVNIKATHTTVVDYCAGFNRSTPSNLKKRGVKIVVRYSGYQSGVYAWKNLTKGEADALRKNDIDIVSVYETSASWMRGGYPAGVRAAKIAKADVIANGGPKNPFVYFACDEDASYTGQVNAALNGATQVLGRDKVGIYGGYTVVEGALKTHSAAKGWQTMAWSQGKVAKGIALYQTIKPYAGALGLDYDSNFPKTDDIGQWGTHAVTTGSHETQASTAPTPVAQVASKFTLEDSMTPNLTALFLARVSS